MANHKVGAARRSYKAYYDEWRRLYEIEFWSTVDIARRHDCSDIAVSKALRKLGVKIRTRTDRYTKHYEAWRSLYEQEKLSSHEIADQFNCCSATVRLALTGMGVEIRDKNDQVYRQSAEDYFWSYVDSRVHGQCWLWTGPTKGPGAYQYGSFRHGGVLTGAHQYSYRIHKGDIPEGFDVAHMCDVKLCVNPNHLVAMPHRANIRDMINKGLHSHGEKHYNARLSREAVRAIRSMGQEGVDHATIAGRFGISYRYVRKVLNRGTWKHI